MIDPIKNASKSVAHSSYNVNIAESQEIQIPFEKYRVRKGDSLIRIAYMFDMSVSYLKKIN
jgi:LysM repeat protein